ncbi:nucleotidyltransferase [Bacillus cereus]|uniref:nucleotidyltransferase n=1 Tax=Bacillus cereus TaxID=1396 RepID=UPI000B4A5434|nr:nucleotidyltransferase [Bacillus cereus]
MVEEEFKIYLFGSALYLSKPNDIDLMIQYDSGKINIKQILNIRKEIRIELHKRLNMDIDISIISDLEEKEINFVNNENAVGIIV